MVFLLSLALFWGDQEQDLESLFLNPDHYVTVPAGSFVMGSDLSPDEQPKRKVTITKAFRLSRTEVSQKQWQRIMGANPSGFPHPERPVEMTNYKLALAFVEALNRKLGGNSFRLPTEAEWEYACRLGSAKESTSGSSWVAANSGGTTHPVTSGNPDQLGLFHMRGNVWEWVSDWYANSYEGLETVNPKGPDTGKHHIIRGGDWESQAEQCRCGFRGNDHHGGKGPRNVYGLRLIWIIEG